MFCREGNSEDVMAAFCQCKLYISILSPVEESASVFAMLPDAQPVESHGIYTVYIYY